MEIFPFFLFFIVIVCIFIFQKKRIAKKRKVEVRVDEIKEINENKKKAVLKWVFIVFCCLFMISFIIEQVYDSEEPVPVKVPIHEKLGITEIEYENYKQIFTKCDLNNITDISIEGLYFESDKEKKPEDFYLIINGEKSPFERDANIFFVETKNNKILKIVVNGFDVYRNGKIIVSAKKCLNLTYDEKYNMESQVKRYVRSQLVSPSSAKFSEFIWGRNGLSEYIAAGMVESKNLFGVELQTRFKAYFNIETRTFRVEYQ